MNRAGLHEQGSNWICGPITDCSWPSPSIALFCIIVSIKKHGKESHFLGRLIVRRDIIGRHGRGRMKSLLALKFPER